MASDEVMVRQVLGLLDRHSSKNLDHAVRQFTDHKQRFHEFLLELKSLKLPTGEGILKGFAHTLKPEATAHRSAQNLQVNCTPLKPVVNSSVVQEDIENYGSMKYTLQSHAKCAPLKPPVDSTVVQAGTEKYGSKQYTLRSRAPRKLSTTIAPQRITRSRAKQTVAAGTAAACSTLPKTEFTVLEDDFVEVRNKMDRKPQQQQQESSEGGFPTEAAASDCHPDGHECQLQDMPVATTSSNIKVTLASRKQPISCQEKLSTPLSIKVFKNLDKERSGLKDTRSHASPTEQFRLVSPQSSQHNLLSKESISVTPYHIIPKCNLQICREARKPQQQQQESSKGSFPTEAAASDCHPNGHECQLQDMPVATTSSNIKATLASPKQPISCQEKLSTPLSAKVFKNLDKERSGLKDTGSHASPTKQSCLLSPQSSQHNLFSKKSISVTPYHISPKCDLQICGEAPKLSGSGGQSSRARLINIGVANLPKSPAICIPSPIQAEQALGEVNDGSHCRVKHERQFSARAKDGAFVVSPKKCGAFEFALTSSIQNQSPRLITDGFHGQSISHKRKLSVYGVSANDQHAAKKRISLSCNSPLYEAFTFDEKLLNMFESTWAKIKKSSPLHGQERATFCEKLNTSRNEDCVEQKESSHELSGIAQNGIANGKASEGSGENLTQVLCEAAGSRDIAQSISKAMECLLSDVGDEKPALPESAEVTTEGVPGTCEMTNESAVLTHEVEPQSQPKALEDQSSFVSEHEHSNRVSLQVEQEDVSSIHNKGISPIKPLEVMVPCLHEHVECSTLEESNHNIGPGDLYNQPNACEDLGKLVLNANSNQATSASSSPVRLQFEQNGRVSLFQGSPQAMSEAVESIPYELDEETRTNSNLAYYSTEALVLESPASVINEEGECIVVGKVSLGFISLKDNFDACRSVGKTSSTSPNMLLRNGETSNAKRAGSMPQVQEMPQVEEIKSCGREVKLETPCSCSHDVESRVLWRPELYQQSPLRSNSLGRPSPSAVKDKLSMESSKCIPNVETKEGITNGDHTSDAESQMDCSESPHLSHSNKEDVANEGILQENESIKEWKATPKGDEGSLNFNQLLAQGTVNSSRRKRARSPAICTEESFKDLKRMKLLSIEKGEQFKDRGLPLLHSQRPSFGRSSSAYGFPHFSPVRRFQDALKMTFEDSPRKSYDFSDFHSSLQREMMGSDKLSKSYSRLPPLPKDYKDTPHFRSVRAGFVDRVNIKSNKQKTECHGITHIEEDLKENQSPKTLSRGKSYSNTGNMDGRHVIADTRRVLGDANRSLEQVESPHERYNFATGTGCLTADTMRVFGHANHSLEELMESPHKRYNLATGTESFLDFVQPKQMPISYPNGKREVRVKALEAAELARKQEEKRENERKMRRMECNDPKGNDSEWAKDKCAPNIVGKGVTDKVKRAGELKMKMDQAKARKQEVEQRRKEEERKKKEAELADRKRKREDADKRDREEKRKRVEEVQRLRKEQEERQRVEFNEKELKWKMMEERERDRKAQEEEAKRQRRLEKEKEAERRRKQDQDSKVARFAGKLAERKRKEAILQARGGSEDDDPVAQTALGTKLSFLSTESFAVSTSNDWDGHSIRTRSQTSGGLRVLSVGTSTYCQKNSAFLVENGAFHSKQVVSGLGSKCEPFKSLSYITPSNTRAGVYASAQQLDPEDEIQSYEISPYKSSSDEEDDEPKKPYPLWARKENLLQQLLCQQRVNPDHIFSSEKTCSLAEIFGTTGSRRCRDFTQRSASGDWLDDHATWKEEHDYKKAMGYL